MKLVPELLCRDIETTKTFYIKKLGFEVKYERSYEFFAYFTRDGVDIMAEEFDSQERHWITGDLEVPFGRGVNFQFEVNDVEELYKRVKELSPGSIYLDLETKSYECAGVLISQVQFLVQGPDGYLFRFCS